MKTWKWIILSTIILIAGCWPEKPDGIAVQSGGVSTKSPVSQPVEPTVPYQYTAFNNDGAAVVTGTIMLPSEYKEGHSFRGSWQLRLTAYGSSILKHGADHIGPQVGEGKLSGNMTAGNIELSMSEVHIEDYELDLRGKFDGRRLTGKWSFYTDAGLTDSGSFEAIRQ